MSDDTEADSRMAAFLKEHPRLMGVLFSMLVALTQVAPVLADGSGSGSGGP